MGSKTIQNAVSAASHSHVIHVDPGMLDRAREKKAEREAAEYDAQLDRIGEYYEHHKHIARKETIFLDDLRQRFGYDVRHFIRIAHRLEINLWKTYKQGETGGSQAWATDMAGALALAEYAAKRSCATE